MSRRARNRRRPDRCRWRMPGGAGLLRRVNLHRAMASAVARDDDLAAHVDAARRELLVVGRKPVVRVDDRRGDVAGRRIGDEPGQELGVARVRIERRWRLGNSEALRTGATRSTAMDFGNERYELVLEHVHVESGIGQSLLQVVGNGHRAGRAGHVRLFRQRGVKRGEAIGRDRRAESSRATPHDRTRRPSSRDVVWLTICLLSPLELAPAARLKPSR